LKDPVLFIDQINMLLMKCRFFLFTLFAAISFISCGQAPNQPTSPSPANQAGSNSISPSLCANVSDPNGETLQVRYFGRIKLPGNSNKFTVIFMPDTQYYTEEPQGNNGGNISMLTAQTTWIANNRASKNIVYVGQLGDCVQNGDNPPGANNEIEWQRFAPAIATIENPALTGLPQGIPFGACVGNHDQTPNGSPTGTTTYFNQYMGASHFAGRTYYGGHYGSNNDNHYELFSASGIDFMVISFEYDQTAGFSAAGSALDWAENLVQNNPGKKVIVMTHYGLNETTSFSTQGQSIYNRLKVYSNFCLLICGHIHTSDGEAQRTDIYNGNRVHTMLSDYQARAGGGNGLLRILEFDPALGKISVKTYSPYNNTFETDPDSQFELSFNMLPLIGQVNNVASGTRPCFNWNNLAFSTNYEWNMELYDGQNLTVGPIWNFTTPAGAALPVALLDFTASTDNKKVRLAWKTANESNNNRFEIERSTDGNSFIKIGEIPGRGNSSSTQEYNFTDEQPVSGKNFYRLKQVDGDGRFKYSDTRLALFDDPGKFVIYPSPVLRSGVIGIYLKNQVRGLLKIAISDMSGKIVYSETKNNPGTNFSIKVNLAAGAYVVKLMATGLDASQKLIVETQ